MNDFEEHFSFIKDDILRKNISHVFQHVTELVLVLDHEKVELKEFFRKTILIQTASIIESLMFYLLQEKRIWDSFSEKWKYTNPKLIHEISKTEEKVWCLRKKITLDKRTDFQEMLKVCKDAGIFSQEECLKIDEIRELRNKIHLHTLSSIDTGLSKKQLENTFNAARIVRNTTCKLLS